MRGHVHRKEYFWGCFCIIWGTEKRVRMSTCVWCSENRNLIKILRYIVNATNEFVFTGSTLIPRGKDSHISNSCKSHLLKKLMNRAVRACSGWDFSSATLGPRSLLESSLIMEVNTWRVRLILHPSNQASTRAYEEGLIRSPRRWPWNLKAQKRDRCEATYLFRPLSDIVGTVERPLGRPP